MGPGSEAGKSLFIRVVNAVLEPTECSKSRVLGTVTTSEQKPCGLVSSPSIEEGTQ